MDDGRALVYRSTRDAVRLTWQREGFAGLDQGLGPALVRVMPQSALTLVLYESVLRLLNAASSQREADAAAARAVGAAAGGGAASG
jgi:solute carrier family 25 folate transporter 32